MNPDFHELLDLEGVPADEQQQLRRVHDLLVEAGPPAELTPALEQAPVIPDADVIGFRRRRRGVAALAIAATIAAVAFGAGYVTGDHGGTGSAAASRVVTFKGSNAVGSLQVGHRDSAGNWPIDFHVTGLPVLKKKYAYYELFVVLRGKPTLPCGGFNVGDGTTSVHFDVPYKIKSTTTWVVTAIDHDHHWPGRTVLT